ncbi:MAG: 2-isopropylmalate synthase [Sulfolobales archaeon]
MFDTTLRDGEQTPGVALTVNEKIEIARALDELGVDVIEAGFPITSKGEFEAVKKISGLGLSAKICALARTNNKDIELALDADVDRVHVFIATSDLHLKYKLGITREEALRRAVESVDYLKSHGVEIEFSAEDATRSDPEFLKQIYSAVAEAGAHYLDIPDTVGTATPEYIARLVREIVSVSRGKIVSVHCHDDFGLATANSIAGILAGARQVHVTINGIGERAGNASLEEVVMALKILYGYELGIRTEKLVEVSRLVSKLTRIPVQPNKAIVGRNAFGHESGIHTHGILRNPATYEPFPPELVGARRWLAVGKHAGSHGIRARLEELGFKVSDEQLKLVVERIKNLGDMGRRVTDKDLVEVVKEVLGQRSDDSRVAELLEVSVTSTRMGVGAIIRISIRGDIYELYGKGMGGVDSIVNAMEKIPLLENVKIKDYSLGIVQIDGKIGVEATVILETQNGIQATASSIKPDPHWAVAEAIVEAINLIMARRGG